MIKREERPESKKRASIVSRLRPSHVAAGVVGATIGAKVARYRAKDDAPQATETMGATTTSPESTAQKEETKSTNVTLKKIESNTKQTNEMLHTLNSDVKQQTEQVTEENTDVKEKKKRWSKIVKLLGGVLIAVTALNAYAKYNGSTSTTLQGRVLDGLKMVGTNVKTGLARATWSITKSIGSFALKSAAREAGKAVLMAGATGLAGYAAYRTVSALTGPQSKPDEPVKKIQPGVKPLTNTDKSKVIQGGSGTNKLGGGSINDRLEAPLLPNSPLSRTETNPSWPVKTVEQKPNTVSDVSEKLGTVNKPEPTAIPTDTRSNIPKRTIKEKAKDIASSVGRSLKKGLDVVEEDFTQKKETFVGKIYPDGKKQAIGYGHDLTPEEMKTGIIELPSGKKIEWKKGISKPDANELYHADKNKHVSQAVKKLKDMGVDFFSLSPAVKKAIGDLAFHIGPGIFNKTPNLVKALKTGDRKGIAKELTDIGTTNASTGKKEKGLVTRAKELSSSVAEEAGPVKSKTGEALTNSTNFVTRNAGNAKPTVIAPVINNAPSTTNNVQSGGGEKASSVRQEENSYKAAQRRSQMSAIP